MSTVDPMRLGRSAKADNHFGTLEECLDQLNDRIAGLERFPHTVLAFALRIHLASLLGALRQQGIITIEDTYTFLQELEREVLGTTD